MKMKVMQILPRMNVGGIERGVLDLVKFFKGKELENIVVSGGGGLVEELNSVNVTHHELPVYKKSLTSLLLIPTLKKIIEKENIDIVHARSRVPGWISFFASRKTRANFITTAHGIYRNRFFSEVMGWGKYVICPSGVVARHMKNIFGVDEEKIIIVNRWVDLNKFKFTGYNERKNSNTIVSIGRISQTKGYEHLIKGFKKVVRFNPYMKLKIVGSADKSKEKYLQHLKTLVSRFSLNFNVEFIGFRPDVEKVLERARLLVAPSVIEESFGRVAVEAMACGVPVIATKMGGFKEIIEDGTDGVLIEPEDSASISENIIKILSDSNFAQRLVKNAREKVEKLYTMEKCLEQTKKVYSKACDVSKILVVKISSFGDLILILPSLEAIKNKFPNSKLSILTSKVFSSILYDCPYVDEVIALDENYKKVENLLAVSKRLRRKSFDYIIDFQNSRASHIISFLSFPRKSFGFARKLGFLINVKAKFPKSENVGPLSSQEKILQLLGIRFKEKKLKFWPTKQQDISVLNLPEDKMIGINVSASKRWKTKNWPVKNITQFIKLVRKELPEYKIALLGDKASEPVASEIESILTKKVINLCGRTNLRQLIEVLRRLDVFITPDTATLHLAQSLGTEVLALFGPTNPGLHTVKDKNLHIIYKEDSCVACYRPKCSNHDCMKQISASEILSKVKELISL